MSDALQPFDGCNACTHCRSFWFLKANLWYLEQFYEDRGEEQWAIEAAFASANLNQPAKQLRVHCACKYQECVCEGDLSQWIDLYLAIPDGACSKLG